MLIYSDSFFVSECTRFNLRECIFQKFPGGMPLDSLEFSSKMQQLVQYYCLYTPYIATHICILYSKLVLVSALKNLRSVPDQCYDYGNGHIYKHAHHVHPLQQVGLILTTAQFQCTILHQINQLQMTQAVKID